MDGSTFHDMFVLGAPIAEKILRTAIVYFFLVIGLRLAGKRELAQLNPFDLVVLFLLSNVVQNAVIGNDNSVTGGLIGAATLLALNWAVVRALYRHERLEKLVEGEEDVLVEGGRVHEDRLARELITRAELEAAAHRQGFDSLTDAERVILEPGGTLAFIAKKPQPEEVRHRELLDRIDRLSRDLEALRSSRGSPGA